MDGEVRNRVKDLRVAKAWTQQDLAEAVGVSRQSINSIERDRYVPSLALALAFARVFRVPVEEIFMLEKRRCASCRRFSTRGSSRIARVPRRLAEWRVPRPPVPS